MTQRSMFLCAALIAGFALAVLPAGLAAAQSVTPGFSGSPAPEFTPTYTPPVVKIPETPRVVGVPARNMPDRLPEMRAPVNPVAAQVNAAQPRRAVLNRLENRLTTEPVSALGNTVAKSPNSPMPARALLESAQPIL